MQFVIGIFIGIIIMCLFQINNSSNRYLDKFEKWLDECIDELSENDIEKRTTFECGELIAFRIASAKLEEIRGNKDV